MVYSIMTQAQRDRIEELRRRERDVQAEEMIATLNQLKDREEVRDGRTCRQPLTRARRTHRLSQRRLHRR